MTPQERDSSARFRISRGLRTLEIEAEVGVEFDCGSPSGSTAHRLGGAGVPLMRTVSVGRSRKRGTLWHAGIA